MNEEVSFYGDKKVDEKLLFNLLKEISRNADSGVFFRKNKEIRLALKKHYSLSHSQDMIRKSFGFIDKEGNSLLSVAYEYQNIAAINIITSFILAHGIEDSSLYQPLTSPKQLMLHRKIGSLGGFAKNLVNIFNQQLNSGNQKESSRLITCYTFVALPRDIQNANKVITDIPQRTQPITFKSKVKRRIKDIKRPLSCCLSPFGVISRPFL